MRLRTNSLLVLSCLALASAAGAATSTVAAIADHFVTTRSGVRIHYLEAGTASSLPTVVFLPAWRVPAFLWSDQLRVMASATRALAIDSRSQGESDKTVQGNTPEGRAEDLHDILGQLGLSRAVLVGWSQGTQDVAAYLQAFGVDSLAGVIFVDSPVLAGPLEVELHPAFAKSILAGISTYAGHSEDYSRAMVKYLFALPHPELDAERLARAGQQTPPETGLSMLMVDIFGVDRRPALAKLTRPTLVIASARSPLLQAQRDMATAIPGAEFLAIEDAGMAVFVDQPAKFSDAVLAFVRKLNAP